MNNCEGCKFAYVSTGWPGGPAHMCLIANGCEGEERARRMAPLGKAAGNWHQIENCPEKVFGPAIYVEVDG